MVAMDYLELARALEREDAGGAVAREAGERLAVYGSLAPGEVNHWVLAGLDGTWTEGTVRGIRKPAGWGKALGFPGLIWNPEADRVAVKLFESKDLPRNWERIDAFEGDDYLRRLIPVERDGALLVANIYALRTTAA
jgi:gamma-glutamylcyclotransferase (GGCT)/AIG2-like uncharacterized protein YtfP